MANPIVVTLDEATAIRELYISHTTADSSVEEDMMYAINTILSKRTGKFSGFDDIPEAR